MSDAQTRSSAAAPSWPSGTLASRILGVIRASMLTALLGVSGALGYDAFSTANTVPTTIYNLVAGGLLNAVLVPQIVRAAKHDDGGEDYLNRLLTLALRRPGRRSRRSSSRCRRWSPSSSRPSRWDSHAVALCVAFAFWCMPQVFFYGAYTMLGQVLNARGNFGPYMWAPVAQQRRRHRRHRRPAGQRRRRRPAPAAAVGLDQRADRDARRHRHPRGRRPGGRPDLAAAPARHPLPAPVRLARRRAAQRRAGGRLDLPGRARRAARLHRHLAGRDVGGRPGRRRARAPTTTPSCCSCCRTR